MSNIILCKGIKLDRDYTNVLSYSEKDMLNVCRNSKYKISEKSEYSFIGVDNTIQTDFTYSQCLKANYIAFQNSDYNNKWFFAFITGITYIDDGCTNISYEIDIWTTWFNDWDKKPCYIIREHVNNDSIGANTVDEGLDVGRMKCIREQHDSSLDNEYGYYFAVASNYDIEDKTEFPSVSLYNGQLFAEKLYLFDGTSSVVSGAINLGLFLLETSRAGKIDSVKNIFIVPNAVINVADLVSKSVGECHFYELKMNNSVTNFTFDIDKYNSYPGYKPKNNKCYCYPYHYLYVDNGNGSSNIYKYEQFENSNDIKFLMSIALTIGCSGITTPQNYQGLTNNIKESIPLGKYPTCEWSSDSFVNWLTQNSVNESVGIANFAGSMINNGSSASGESIGASVSSQIGGQIGRLYTASLLPNVRGGTNTADIKFLNSWNNIYYYEMRCEEEYLKIIDDYFTRFGYKINRVMEPNIVGRKNWNYLEIGSSEIIGTGDVPAQYMNRINEICRRGVTIWHNHDNIGNFNLDNSIV